MLLSTKTALSLMTLVCVVTSGGIVMTHRAREATKLTAARSLERLERDRNVGILLKDLGIDVRDIAATPEPRVVTNADINSMVYRRLDSQRLEGSDNNPRHQLVGRHQPAGKLVFPCRQRIAEVAAVKHRAATGDATHDPNARPTAGFDSLRIENLSVAER